jgi:hypothetical protein
VAAAQVLHERVASRDGAPGRETFDGAAISPFGLQRCPQSINATTPTTTRTGPIALSSNDRLLSSRGSIASRHTSAAPNADPRRSDQRIPPRRLTRARLRLLSPTGSRGRMEHHRWCSDVLAHKVMPLTPPMRSGRARCRVFPRQIPRWLCGVGFDSPQLHDTTAGRCRRGQRVIWSRAAVTARSSTVSWAGSASTP